MNETGNGKECARKVIEGKEEERGVRKDTRYETQDTRYIREYGTDAMEKKKKRKNSLYMETIRVCVYIYMCVCTFITFADVCVAIDDI